MKFNNPVSDVIRERFSCRTFNGNPIRQEERQKIEQLLETASCRNFRFSFVEKSSGAHGEKIGTYGIIRNANEFIAGVIRKNADPVEFGAILETIVLYAEDMGLSTLWLGGTFHKDGFIARLKPSEDELVPIVIAVGYEADAPSLADRIARTFISADRRKRWKELFFDGTFAQPLTPDAAADYADILEMARIAPSAVNYQPWRVLHNNDGYHFFIARKPGYLEKSGFDMQMVDMGIAISHFVIAARQSGFQGRLSFTPPACATDLEYVRSWLIKQM